MVGIMVEKKEKKKNPGILKNEIMKHPLSPTSIPFF
jgi:hypothetical protein